MTNKYRLVLVAVRVFQLHLPTISRYVHVLYITLNLNVTHKLIGNLLQPRGGANRRAHPYPYWTLLCLALHSLSVPLSHCLCSRTRSHIFA